MACNNTAKQKSNQSSKEITAQQVVNNAINTAGTLEKWKNIAQLSYTKKSRLLLENGEVESEVVQQHHYTLKPKKEIRISWTVGDDHYLLLQNHTNSFKFKNDSLIAQGNAVKTSINSAVYVLGMPFKLLDNGTQLSL